MCRNVQSILFAILLVCALALVGCSSSDNNPAPPAAVQSSILTGGGAGGSNGGTGGGGNYIELYNDYGTGGNIVISATGSADASFTPSSFTPYYGIAPLTLSSNTTITLETVTEPAAGIVYLGSDNYLRISDGNSTLNDEPKITGLLIESGATVTFGVAGTANLSIYMDNDFVNYGTLTSADQDSTRRGSLNINSGSFLNFGAITLNATGAGQNGGDLNVTASITSGDGGSVLNHGTIATYGEDATDADAGSGGYVYLYGENFCENTGAIDSYGGAAAGTTGIGGNGGYVYWETNLGDTRNSATINSYGGTGVTGGGNGGYVKMYIDYTGDCVSSGILNTYGGDTATGTGGTGGYVEYYTWQGGLRHNAAINARGGSATNTAGSGGNGGYVEFGSYSGSSYEPTPGYYSPVKDTEVSGTIDLRGGDAVADGSGNGGSGGYAYFDIEGDYLPRGQELRLLGYQALDTRGGNGNFGGYGGYIYAWQEYAYDYDQYFNPGGFLVDGITIDTRGGNAVATSTTKPASGGEGGYVEFDMTTYTYQTAAIVDFAPPKFYLRGSINTSGGESLEETTSTGNAGYVYVYAKAGVEVVGDITARGGNDAGTTAGYGGYGAYVSLMADYGDVTIEGSIDMSGGNGALNGGAAGSTSDPIAATSQGVVTVGNITADGGDADPTISGSVGGDAADFWLFAPQGPASVSFAALSAKGGTGETAGADGVISAGAYQVAP